MSRTLTVVLVLAASPAAAQSTPAEALAAWASAYAAMSGEKSAAVYAADARLWGTASRAQTVGRDAIRDYFDAGSRNLRSRTVVIGEHAIQLLGDVAVASGHYEFRNTRNDGASTARPSRFSMTLASQGGRWLIVNHHSSQLPDAPAAPPPSR
jgi:uncharacterized protein (TIGR02246 family)